MNGVRRYSIQSPIVSNSSAHVAHFNSAFYNTRGVQLSTLDLDCAAANQEPAAVGLHAMPTSESESLANPSQSVTSESTTTMYPAIVPPGIMFFWQVFVYHTPIIAVNESSGSEVC